MITRDSLEEAARQVLDEHARACKPLHRTLARRIADRVGLPAPALPLDPATNPATVAGSLDALGTGVFVRRVSDWPIEVLARFDWAIVAVISEGRGRLNRDPAWWADARAAGVELTAMDWLPGPRTWRSGLREAVEWSAEHGSICYVQDAEKPWHHELESARAYVAETDRICKGAGCARGFTSFATLPLASEWRAFAEGAGLLIPQPYDRWGAYELGYAERCVARWRALGGEGAPLALGRGAFVDPDGPGPEHARWRSPQEIERHRALTPTEGLAGTAWWPPVGTPAPRVVDAIVRP